MNLQGRPAQRTGKAQQDNEVALKEDECSTGSYFVSMCISLPVCVTTNTAGLDTLEHLPIPKTVGKSILTGRTQACVIFQLMWGCHPSCLSQ